MAGSVPQPAEVTRCHNDALAKMVLPDSIDNNSCSERLTGNRLSKLQTASAAGKGSRRIIAENLQESSRSFVTQIERAPAQVNLEIPGLVRV